MSKINLPLALAILLFPFTAFSADPEPFRRDEIEGRNFSYSDKTFLHHFSYRHRAGWIDEWDDYRQGFRITAGSISTRRMYVVNEFRKEIDFSPRFYGELRFFRNEDFDSRYDRFLTGLGIKLPSNWKFGVYSDIVAEKENVDLQFEAEWRESPEAQTEKRYKKEGNRFRTAFILTDHFFNQKSRDGEYTSNPYTFFAEGRYIPKEGSSISSWINFNPRTRLEFFEDEFSFIYRQFTGGARVKLPILYNTNLYITLKAEEGLRKREALSEGFTTARDMRRYNEIFEAEITQDLNHEFQVWGGARYFRLLEKDRISSALKQEGELLRREPIIYSGILWKIEENIFFWPGIFISFLDNKNTSTVDAQEEKTSDTIGKIDLPIEYQLSNHEAKFVFNPTFQFPRDFFGGFNVQVQFLL